MGDWEINLRTILFLGLALILGTATAPAAEDRPLAVLQYEAVRKAVDRVAPSVVSIETIGGLERADGVLFGTGATTGVIVSPDGYIISSAFNFAQKPTSILVGLPDGTRTPAQLVATDRSRMLTLLKINVEDALTVPEVAPAEELAVGQWAIAVGRTFEATAPNISVGIISALNRIWGKAIQTDAKISPANYGGPLVDIRGRVTGILVPLSATPGDRREVAGVEWYDSGIGFAIPLAHVMNVLPKLQSGSDLMPGILGISLKREQVAGEPAVIAVCRPNSPAYKAGFKPGDKIVAVEGVEIERGSQLLEQIYRRYAGDKLRVAVVRGDQRIERQVELIDRLDPYQRAFFGFLPERDLPAGPVRVRYVYPDSAADRAGLKVGDAIVAVGDTKIESRDAMLVATNDLELGQPTKLTILRDGQERELTIKTAADPQTTPEKLPPAFTGEPAGEAIAVEKPVGQFEIKIPGHQNAAVAYVPETYDPRRGYGMLVWLHARGGFEDDALVQRWRTHCLENNLIFLAPHAANEQAWQRADLEFVAKAMRELQNDYRVDPWRVVVHGTAEGAAVAYELAYIERELVRGLAAVRAPSTGRPGENDPQSRLALHITVGRKADYAEQVEGRVEQLRQLKYPVEFHWQDGEGRYYSDAELMQMLRWIDTLDRM